VFRNWIQVIAVTRFPDFSGNLRHFKKRKSVEQVTDVSPCFFSSLPFHHISSGFSTVSQVFFMFFSSFFPILSRGPGSGAPRAGSLLGDSSAPAGAEGSGQRFFWWEKWWENG
jgi:hypothetical protein